LASCRVKTRTNIAQNSDVFALKLKHASLNSCHYFHTVQNVQEEEEEEEEEERTTIKAKIVQTQYSVT